MSLLTFEPIALDDFEKVLGTTSTEISSVALGGKILSCSDEWFAPASDLLKVSQVHLCVVGSHCCSLIEMHLGMSVTLNVLGWPGTKHERAIWSQWSPL